MSARGAMGQFLTRVGQMPLQNGPDLAGTARRQVGPNDIEFFRGLVTSQASQNKVALAIALALVCATFVLTAAGAWRAGNSVPMFTAVVGTGLGGEVGLLYWLRILWADSNIYTVMLVASERLTAEELVKLVGTLYFKGGLTK